MIETFYLLNGDWGLGIGDWGLGIGYWAKSTITKTQFPNPKTPIKFKT